MGQRPPIIAVQPRWQRNAIKVGSNWWESSAATATMTIIRDKLITSLIKKEARESTHGEQLATCTMERNHWTPGTLHQVDWDTCETSTTKINLRNGSKTRITKCAHCDWLPVGCQQRHTDEDRDLTGSSCKEPGLSSSGRQTTWHTARNAKPNGTNVCRT